MRSFRHQWTRWLVLLIASFATLALTGCGTVANTPQSVLNPFSEAAQRTADLFYIIFWVAVVIFILVEGLLVFFVIRYQRRAADDQVEQYHGNTRLEITWTLVPAIILAGVFALTMREIGQVGPTNAPSQGTPIAVAGHQWFWEIDYDGGKVKTAQELHMPTGTVMNISLSSDNVIHSFWVPSLMGKTDTIPGHDNKTWLLSDQPGTYDGQCTEFCGAQHAHMLFRVVVQSPADYKAWLTNQEAPAVEPAPGTPAERGKAFFLNPTNKCIGCHTINGTNAAGVTGPNLTHLMSRSCFAGCEYPLTHDNLVRWLQNPQAMKPGNLMVINQLTPDQISDLTAYLESLK